MFLYEWQVSITEDKQKCNYYLMRIIRRLCKLWDYGPSSHGVGTILGIISQWEIKDRAAKYWGGWEGTIFHNVLLTPIKACPLSKNIWVPPPWIIRSPPAKICLCAFSCYFHKIRQDLEVLVINMAPKWPMGPGKGSSPLFLGAPVIIFLSRALLQWEM